jgi:hypothetical protein
LLGLLFHPEDGGKTFIQNVGLSEDYWMLQSRRPTMPQLSNKMEVKRKKKEITDFVHIFPKSATLASINLQKWF